MSIWGKCSLAAIITAVLLFILSVIGYLFLSDEYISLIAIGACIMAILGIIMGFIGLYKVDKPKRNKKKKANK